MNMYEFTFLVENENEQKTLADILTSVKGKINQEQKWGKRMLSYPIKKQKSAHYFTWYVELEPNNLAEFKKKLNFTESLLRYLLLKKESLS